MSDTVTDRSLVERHRRDRDDESFSLLYRRHTPALFRLAVTLSGRADLAADIVQETWLRAARGLETFQWSSELRTGLCGIAINCSRELSRHARRDEVAEPPARAATAPELRLDLLRAVGDLPERSREVLILHEVLGYTHPEIGALLGIDEGTSRSQLSYSKSCMRRWFARGTANAAQRSS